MTLNMKLMEERQEGELIKSISAVRECRKEMSTDWMSRVFHITNSELETILELLDTNPDWTDEDIADDILGYN